MGEKAKSGPAPALAYHDFYKTNGTDTTFYPVGPSMTRQEFAEECDINTLMSKYDAHLSDPMRSIREPMYVDLTAVPNDLMSTMALVQSASDAFFRLPAAVRREFDNDPVLFTEFAYDPENIDQLRAWGLAKPKPVEPSSSRADAAPVQAPPLAPAPAPGPASDKPKA